MPWVHGAVRVALSIQCAAAAGAVLNSGSALNTFLFHDLHIADPILRELDRGVACALVLAAISCVFARGKGLFVAIAAWFLLESLLSAYNGGYFAAPLAPFSRAVRYLAPLALIALLDEEEKRAVRLLAWGSALVFAAHGIEAVLANPRFVDFLIVTVDRVSGMRMSQSAAEVELLLIGLVDLGLAILVIKRPCRSVWIYMAFWGFTTAVMRSIYYGPEIGWHHTLVRIFNGGAPLLLLQGRTDRWLEPSSPR